MGSGCRAGGARSGVREAWWDSLSCSGQGTLLLRLSFLSHVGVSEDLC